MTRTLTLQTLIDKHACLSQAELFGNTFGDSVEVTPELCLSVADKFDWDWAARHLPRPTHWSTMIAPGLAHWSPIIAPEGRIGRLLSRQGVRMGRL